MGQDDIAPSDMLLFVSVVRERSLTAAARLRGISKQAVSRRLAGLEERLGVRLLERTTRSLRPTEAGAAYYETCARIAEQIAEANETVRAGRREPLGTLRLTSPVLYGRRYLAPIVASFLRAYPRTRVDVLLTDRRVNLVEEGIDVAVRVGRASTDASLTARRIGEGRMVVVASPSLVEERGRPTPRSLSGMPCIGMRTTEVWRVRGVDVKVEPVFVVNDLEVGCEAAVLGAGVARLPTIVCREEVQRGALTVLFEASGLDPFAHDLFAVWPSRKFLPAKVRRFVDLLASSGGAIRA